MLAANRFGLYRFAKSCRRLTTSSSSIDRSGINLKRYPIHVDSAIRRKIIEEARESLATTGCASFPQFITEEATQAAAHEARKVADVAFVTCSEHNAYQLTGQDPKYPENHVRNLAMLTKVASTAYDEVEGQLKALYEYDGLVEFVAAVLGRDAMYRLADPLGACSVNIFRPGWLHAWHFDESKYTTTLCLQAPDKGGEFEYSLPLRSSTDHLADTAVANIIRNHSSYTHASAIETNQVDADVPPTTSVPSPVISTATFEPGTLQIFEGWRSLHRVKEIDVDCQNDRLVAVMCFAEQPGVRNSLGVQEMFWGRIVTDVNT